MDLPIVSLDTFLAGPSTPAAFVQARRAAESLVLTGAVVVRDSRADQSANDRFLDLFEDYFVQFRDELVKDERPQYGYQVGVTLENTEKPKCGSDDECLAIIAQLEERERPLDLSGTGADPKCRFFHRMSEPPPYESAFPVLSIKNVIPRAFPQWEEKVDEWGRCMKLAVEGVGRMLAVGLGLEEMTFLEAGRYGSHLLAPTATDLQKYGQLGTVFAGFHTDMNFLTIHGQSRYPGLNIWARNSGKRIAVKIPPGCLLVQAGKQLEWVTGGLIKAGFHEVVCTQATLETASRRKRDHLGRPLIRISSTFFWHLSSDYTLKPDSGLEKIAEDRFGTQKAYGSMKVGEQVQRELGLIALLST